MVAVSRDMRDAVTLIGAYKQHNLGDDVLCHLFVRALRQHGYDTVYLPSASEEVRRALDVAESIGTRRSIDRSRLVVLGGGGALGRGVISVREEEKFRYYHRVAWYCRIRRIPLYVMGIGAGPLVTRSSRQRAREIVSIARQVIVRDETSREALVELSPRCANKVQVLSDPAFALPFAEVASEPRGASAGFQLGVNLCDVRCFDRGLPAPAACRELIETVKRLVAEQRVQSVVWLSTIPSGGELTWACRGAQALPHCSRVVFHDGDPWAWLRTLASCHALLGMKLHSALFAAGLGVPLIGVGFHPKVERFYRRIGAEDFCRSLDTLAVGELSQFVQSAFPGAGALRERSVWQESAGLAQRVFETIPAAVTEPAPT